MIGGFLRQICLAWALVALSLTAQPLYASSPDAWEEFRQDVERACRSALPTTFMVGNILIDPFGSESYGFALIIGLEPGGQRELIIVCAYDKTSQRAEVSGYMNE